MPCKLGKPNRKRKEMVIHILKNGQAVDDIKGHVVRREDFPSLYALIDRLNDENRRKENEKKDS